MSEEMMIDVNKVIGETVLKLIGDHQQPGKNALLANLAWQAEHEQNDARLLALWQARRALHPTEAKHNVYHINASTGL